MMAWARAEIARKNAEEQQAKALAEQSSNPSPEMLEWARNEISRRKAKEAERAAIIRRVQDEDRQRANEKVAAATAAERNDPKKGSLEGKKPTNDLRTNGNVRRVNQEKELADLCASYGHYFILQIIRGLSPDDFPGIVGSLGASLFETRILSLERYRKRDPKTKKLIDSGSLSKEWIATNIGDHSTRVMAILVTHKKFPGPGKTVELIGEVEFHEVKTKDGFTPEIAILFASPDEDIEIENRIVDLQKSLPGR